MKGQCVFFNVGINPDRLCGPPSLLFNGYQRLSPRA